MQTEHRKKTKLTLQEVSAKFEEWRTNKQMSNTTTAKIPNDLWQQVSQLFNHYSLTKIRKTLNLNSRQLKSKFQKYSSNYKNPVKTIKTKQPTFIPISIPQPKEEIEPNFIGKVEIKRSDGATISIESLNQHTLTLLLTQFMQGL